MREPRIPRKGLAGLRKHAFSCFTFPEKTGAILALWKTPSHFELEHWRDGAAPAALSSCPEGKSLFG